VIDSLLTQSVCPQAIDHSTAQGRGHSQFGHGGQGCTGTWGEEYAARYVTLHFDGVLARNWRSPAGEVDLVFRDGPSVVVCEVKTRRDVRKGHPSEAIDATRIERLKAAAELWLAADVRDTTARIDAICVTCAVGGVVLQHFQDVAA